jgi:hypothetical protein
VSTPSENPTSSKINAIRNKTAATMASMTRPPPG